MENNKVVDSLEKLADITSKKYQNTFILSSTSSMFTKSVSPVIDLEPDRSYKAAVQSFSVYNAIRNVRKDINDTFRYSSNNGTSYTNIVIYPGSYNVQEIIDDIHRQTGIASSATTMQFVPDVKTNTIIMTLGTNYKVDFSVAHNLRKIFGFNEAIYSAGTIRSPNRPQIIDFHTILVKTNLISGGYVSSIDSHVLKPNNIIFSLPTFTVPTGSKLIERPQTLTWHPVIQKNIERVHIEVINEHGDPIDFGSEEISLVISIRQI